MNEPKSNLVSGIVSLVETMESVDFIGISEIDFENNFLELAVSADGLQRAEPG